MRSDSIQGTAPPDYPKIGPGWGRPSVPTCLGKEQRDGALQASPPWKTPSRSPGQQNKQERHPHHKGPASPPKRGRRKRITKGSQTKPNKVQEKHNPQSQCHSLPRRAVGHWRSQCLLMSTRIPTKGLHNCDRKRPRPIPKYGACSRARRTGRTPAVGACPTRGMGMPPRCHVCILKTKPHKETLKQKTQG